LLARRLIIIAVAIATSLGVIFTQLQPGQSLDPSQFLPTLQAHSLPPHLSQWQDTNSRGDYFEEIQPTPVGYLIWSQFPLKLYIERPVNASLSASSQQRFQEWVEAVLPAVEAWSAYLPLEVVEDSAAADIKIWRSRPPLIASLDRENGKFQIPRARAAETRYEFYLRPTSNNATVLSHRCTIHLSPDQSNEYTAATARHELGHALGIWGHSPVETDALYFSQVRNPPPISPRDINTLKRIYQQPTRLGWAMPEN
jgi:predicted Zn-dependent protease